MWTNPRECNNICRAHRRMILFVYLQSNRITKKNCSKERNWMKYICIFNCDYADIDILFIASYFERSIGQGKELIRYTGLSRTIFLGQCACCALWHTRAHISFLFRNTKAYNCIPRAAVFRSTRNGTMDLLYGGSTLWNCYDSFLANGIQSVLIEKRSNKLAPQAVRKRCAQGNIV